MALDTNIKVLIVDDFSTMRKIIRNILTQLGFKNILEADDGTTALEILSKEKVDLIISDWNMPKMSGLDLLKAVRANEATKDLPFVMVTAEAQKENILEAIKYKVSQYIVKPFTPETLKEKLEKVFGG
ncbi:chemotaxis protein CheY [Caldimicrobium thiodismutans]|jgi:two-component system chemotaxis response regulator CheY|uniref:Chemotaxis protein CheY n=1 Tax=Caldimicrobium thiodismutans TaxID=1653476 RepID=A0A0U5BVW1_9BACT|nr:chemotaxis response regulator CheY [Caldimicrobium thiodismutans]BAU22757.1 chemotaxis protein CheY [Caldimicrobium thiodismutans]